MFNVDKLLSHRLGFSLTQSNVCTIKLWHQVLQNHNYISLKPNVRGLWYLTLLSTIFQLYRGGQFYWIRNNMIVNRIAYTLFKWCLKFPKSVPICSVNCFKTINNVSYDAIQIYQHTKISDIETWNGDKKLIMRVTDLCLKIFTHNSIRLISTILLNHYYL
jgi:hypothetical protein